MKKKKKLTKGNKDPIIEFGKRVKQIRKELDFSQKQFAKELGMSGSFLSEIEYGKTRPG